MVLPIYPTVEKRRRFRLSSMKFPAFDYKDPRLCSAQSGRNQQSFSFGYLSKLVL